jgi:hypothetical protein
MPTLEQQSADSQSARESRSQVALLGAGLAIAADRAPAGRRRRAAARADEDAVTLAADAAALALPDDVERVAGVIFATTTPPYLEGGSVQPLVELLGFQGDVFAIQLSGSLRDGLAAIRIAAALVGAGPILVCAAHAGAGDPTMGDGAVALLLGGIDGGGSSGSLATLTPAASSSIELRDRWRLPGDEHPRDADKSFVQEIGTQRLGRDLFDLVPDDLKAPAVVVGPDVRGSGRLEKALGDREDDVSASTGILGAAHPLLRMLASLDSPGLVLSLSNGLGEAVHVDPEEGGAELAREVIEQSTTGGTEVDRPSPVKFAADFDPYSSGPRAWRDRDIDLRLSGLVGGSDGLPMVPGRRRPVGTVVSRTTDNVYPPTKSTEMAVVAMDDGGQFYGQVAIGEHVAIDDRVELVPRRLHNGGGMIQYFWKVRPCR